MAFLPPFEEAKQNPDKFIESVNVLFETAPPLANKLLEIRNQLSSYSQLIERSAEIISHLKPDEQLEVINAHPRLGLDPSQAMSALSRKEQGVDQDKLMDQEKLKQLYDQLGKLNEAYEKKMGFKFVTFVNGRKREELIPEWTQRLSNTPEVELQKGLNEMLLIAKDRLKKLTSNL